VLEDDSRGDVIVEGTMEKESEDNKHHGTEEQELSLKWHQIHIILVRIRNFIILWLF